MFKLLLTANYMNISSLLDLVAAKVYSSFFSEFSWRTALTLLICTDECKKLLRLRRS